MLLLSAGCTCEAVGSLTTYQAWFGRAFGVCVYNREPRDIVAAFLLGLHVLAFTFATIPQLIKNHRTRTADNLSVACLIFVLLSEGCFLVAQALQRWSWLWVALRMWRVVFALLLLAQTAWFKRVALRGATAYSSAVEAPFARAGAATDAYYEQHDVERDESDRVSLGWPTRSATPKATKYGMAPAPWGHALLADGGGGTPPQRPSATAMSSSPSRSRLPNSHAHLSAQAAPRTVAASQAPHLAHATRAPSSKATHAGSYTAPVPHSSSLNGSLIQPSGIPSIDNERRRAAYAAQQHSLKRGSYSPSSPSNNAGTSFLSSAGSGFTTSPTSAFHPIHTAEVTSDAYEQEEPTEPKQGGTKLFSIALCVIGLTVWSLSSGVAVDSMASSAAAPHAGRVLLSTAPTTGEAFGASLLPLSGVALGDAFSVTSEFCNDPFDPQPPVSTLIRVFGWVACLFGALALFPQFVYNDSYMQSVGGLSFLTYGLTALGNLTLVLGMVVPRHNDWLENRYADNNADHQFAAWYRDQVILPVLVTSGFNFMQVGVLLVQRHRYKRNHLPR